MVEKKCTSLYIGAKAVSDLFERVSQVSIQTRFFVDENAWPPNQLKDFTPLFLVYHQGQCLLYYLLSIYIGYIIIRYC